MLLQPEVLLSAQVCALCVVAGHPSAEGKKGAAK